MQRGADTHHARAKHENVSLQFRHSSLRKSNVSRAAMPASSANQRRFNGNHACAATKLDPTWIGQ
jgi:hypothetical protein